MANATQKNQSRTTGKPKVGATVPRTSFEFLQSTLYNPTVCWSLPVYKLFCLQHHHFRPQAPMYYFLNISIFLFLVPKKAFMD